MRMISMVRLFEVTLNRVVKSLDGKYGANLRHIINESVPSGDLSGIAQTLDYLKSSSILESRRRLFASVRRITTVN